MDPRSPRNADGHSGDGCIQDGNFASEQCGKIALFQQSGKCNSVQNGPILETRQSLSSAPCSTSMNMGGRLKQIGHDNFIFISTMSKSYQTHQHESTFNIFLRWISLACFSVFAKIFPFQRSLSTVRYCNVLPPSPQHRRCCWVIGKCLGYFGLVKCLFLIF